MRCLDGYGIRLILLHCFGFGRQSYTDSGWAIRAPRRCFLLIIDSNVNDRRRLFNGMEGETETETKKEQRETAALTRKCSDSFAPAWYGVRLGMGKHALRCWKPLEKENHLDCSQEPLYTMHISGPAFVYGFYPIAVNMISEMLKT